MGPDGHNFVKRQQIMSKKKTKQKQARIKSEMLRSECTFKPDTGSATEVLRHTRPHRLNESNLERIERLYHSDVQNKEQKRKGKKKTKKKKNTSQQTYVFFNNFLTKFYFSIHPYFFAHLLY